MLRRIKFHIPYRLKKPFFSADDAVREISYYSLAGMNLKEKKDMQEHHFDKTLNPLFFSARLAMTLLMWAGVSKREALKVHNDFRQSILWDREKTHENYLITKQEIRDWYEGTS